MRSIQVTPEVLERHAAKITEAHDSYIRCVSQLFDAVETMRAGWKGKDNLTFQTKISKFEGDFRQMAALCIQYAEFLRNSAQAYRAMQEDLAAQAQSLGA